MLCLEEGRAREGWGWHDFLSPPSPTAQEIPGIFHIHQCSSRSERKHWIQVVDGAREGLLGSMGEFEELPSIRPAWPEDRLPCTHDFSGSLCYLIASWGCCTRTQSQIFEIHQQGSMWEQQPGLGFCSKSSSEKKK